MLNLWLEDVLTLVLAGLASAMLVFGMMVLVPDDREHVRVEARL